MDKILGSATKIVLLTIIISLVFMTSAVVFMNLKEQSVVTGILSLFSNVVVAIVSFYFGQKTANNNNV